MNGSTMCIGKVAHRTEREARLAKRGTRLRVYECPVCGRWHLTSKPAKRRPRRRARKGMAW
jgi:tRNA(Ile2) C34 agmatinyltransferase TiaS